MEEEVVEEEEGKEEEGKEEEVVPRREGKLNEEGDGVLIMDSSQLPQRVAGTCMYLRQNGQPDTNGNNLLVSLARPIRSPA